MSSEGLSTAEYCIQGWINLYVSGSWTLEKFERHLEAMLPLFRLEDWATDSQTRWASNMARS